MSLSKFALAAGAVLTAALVIPDAVAPALSGSVRAVYDCGPSWDIQVTSKGCQPVHPFRSDTYFDPNGSVRNYLADRQYVGDDGRDGTVTLPIDANLTASGKLEAKLITDNGGNDVYDLISLRCGLAFQADRVRLTGFVIVTGVVWSTP